jgi:hypothetical protein
VSAQAQDIVSNKDNLVKLRENVMVVVRGYNEIIEALEPWERLLFVEQIRNLDKKIRSGEPTEFPAFHGPESADLLESFVSLARREQITIRY